MEEKLDFRLYQKGIEFIQKEIVTSPVALREWHMCINSFVTNESSRKRLRDEYKGGQLDEVILKTLEEWIEKQTSKATLGALIQLLRKHDFNYICGSLEAKAEDIRRIQFQSTSPIVIENGRIRNFWFGMTDVPNFVGRVEDLQTLHKLVTENRVEEEHDSLALLTSVHGFGGIGKTTLARMYAWKYRNYFDGNVIWIDSETFTYMKGAFEGVAEALNLEVDMTNVDINRLTKSVYNAFEDSKCLFIFDNAEEFNGENGVEQFLPSGIIRKPYLLITSRRNDIFSTNRILRLDVLSPSDSIELVKKYIPGATYEIADKLSERLDRVPLAIHQAIAYIKKLLPLQNRSSNDDVQKSINSFLEEYEYNSNKILNSEFKGVDGYGKNIFSICEMSLRKMENEEGGKLAKHMLGYISFLHPGNIYLDFVLNLPYQLESSLDELQKIVRRRSVEKTKNTNMTVRLLSSYSLIDINTTEKTIKVHRLVQDAIRFMLLRSEELHYVKHLLAGLDDQEFNKKFSHWISIKRSCRFGDSVSYFESVIPTGVNEFMQLLNSAGLNIDVSKNLVKLANKFIPCALSLIASILKAMKCKDLNESVEIYLDTFNKIESALEDESALLLTNYFVFANFVISEVHKILCQSIFECVSIFQIKNCKRTLLQEMLGTNFHSEDVSVVLDIIYRSGISIITNAEFVIDYLYDVYLFCEDLQIEPLSNEFPCLNSLKSSSSFTNIDELQALNLSWDFKNSIVWTLFNNLEFNLAAIRSAMACICFIGCTIAEYLEKYYETISEVEQEYKKLETIVQVEQSYKSDGTIVQFVNAKLLREDKPKYYALLSLICCLPAEFSMPYRFKYILDKLDTSEFQFCWRALQKLENLGFVRETGEDIYFMTSNLQVSLRKNVISLEDKTQAVNDLHKTCEASRNGECFDEMVKYWHHLMEERDLREIALNCSLSFGDLQVIEASSYDGTSKELVNL